MVSAVSLEALAQQRSNESNHKRRAQDHIAMDTLEKRPRGEIVQQSLPAWGFHTSIGGRPYQEDAYLHAELQLPANFPLTTCFGVFDGHGGPAVSNHLSQNAASYISEALRSAQSPEAALKLAFTSLDSALPNDSKDLGGSTATVCLVSEDQIICANCGDSRAVLARGGEAVPLSEDHSTTRKDEIERVLQAGGRILNNAGARVMGVLSMTRAIGDTWLRRFGVIPEPDVVALDRTPQDEFVVMATDGLWGSVSSAEAVHIARRCLERAAIRGISRHAATRIAAKVLMRAAMHRGSRDNVTVIVFDLRSEDSDGAPAAAAEKFQQKSPNDLDVVESLDDGSSSSESSAASGEDSEDSPSPFGVSMFSVSPTHPFKQECNSPELQQLLDLRQEQEEHWGCILPRNNLLFRGAQSAAWPMLPSGGSGHNSPMTERTCSGRLISTGEILVKAITSHTSGPQLV